jgi:hypothetical protein
MSTEISQESIKIVEQEIERVNSTIKDEELRFGSHVVNSRVRELGNTFRNKYRENFSIPFYSEHLLQLFLDGKLKPSDKFGFSRDEFHEFEKEFVESGRERQELFRNLHDERLKWYCELCFDLFDEENSVIEHIKKSHEKEEIHEEFENMKENDFDGKPTIKDLVNNEMQYFCKICNKKFESSRSAYGSAKGHYEELHSIDDMKKSLNFKAITEEEARWVAVNREIIVSLKEKKQKKIKELESLSERIDKMEKAYRKGVEERNE